MRLASFKGTMELLVDPSFSAEGLLCEEESAHCVKVLRHKAGDCVFVTDGAGALFSCRLAKADPRGCRLDIEDVKRHERPKPDLWMAVAPTKNADRFEWFVEKAVEIGVGRITPLVCERSERARVRVDRLERLVVAAAKQSLKFFLPRLDEPLRFSDILKDANLPAQRFILHCGAAPKRHLFNAASPDDDALVLIGPEGDFSPSEVAMATNAACVECTLGPERLRTETAALVATNIFSLRSQLRQQEFDFSTVNTIK